MRTSKGSGVRRLGRVLTGLGSLVVLVGLGFGGPVALIELAGNPLPDHIPGLAEIGTTLTSRDDGQLFLRVLALVGWAGWATFALSVLVELPARMFRRPAIRLPGLGRQQRLAATLVGAVAMIVVTSPAATAAMAAAAPAVVATAPSAHPGPALAGAGHPGTPTAGWTPTPTQNRVDDPVYRVAKDDYLGHIAGRYLGDFNRYPELAKLNRIHDPDRIRPGQLIRLPVTAEDRGIRRHATGPVSVPPTDQRGDNAPTPGTGQATPGTGKATPGTGSGPATPPAAPAPVPDRDDDSTTYAVGAAHSTQVSQLNRPLAVSAVIAVASMIGAQIGAVLGLRRQPDPGRHRRAGS